MPAATEASIRWQGGRSITALRRTRQRLLAMGCPPLPAGLETPAQRREEYGAAKKLQKEDDAAGIRARAFSEMQLLPQREVLGGTLGKTTRLQHPSYFPLIGRPQVERARHRSQRWRRSWFGDSSLPEEIKEKTRFPDLTPFARIEDAAAGQERCYARPRPASDCH